MKAFETYLRKLSDHEAKKTSSLKLGTRSRILVESGIRLNWIGDFVANPNIQFRKILIPVEKIYFTGTGLEWNKILLKKCKSSVVLFRKLIEKDKLLKAKFTKEASVGKEPILVRRAEKVGYYKVLDGMHRFVGAVIQGKKKITAYAPINESKHLPFCEPHVIYDLIRGYQRNAKDKKGATDLYHALVLLKRCYANVPKLLKERFNLKYVLDKEVQAMIKKVLQTKTK